MNKETTTTSNESSHPLPVSTRMAEKSPARFHVEAASARAEANVSFVDRFSEDRPAGRVIGTLAEEGITRKGIDKEGAIAIERGALRIHPLIRPEWARVGIAYGPYARRNGLAFGTFLINGHNISQSEALPDGFKGRLVRWALGSETEKPLVRISRWLRSHQKKFAWRRLRQWIRSGTKFFKINPIKENLAIGWFSETVPSDPLHQGNAFIMHALRLECGELWARTGATCQRTVRGLQNVQMYYFVVLREHGAAYYAASLEGVPGVGNYPRMRLLAIDPSNAEKTVYAGIHQSAVGEIGFRATTGVYRTQVATLPEFDQWYGSAHGADVLKGDGPLLSCAAEVGGRWTMYEGEFQRTDRGLTGLHKANIAVLQLNSPSGLIHVLIQTADKPVQGVAVIWRAIDQDNYWSFEVGSKQCQLSVKEGGVWCRFPATTDCHLVPNSLNSVQVCDDGEAFSLYLNGELVYATRFSDVRLGNATGVGIRTDGSSNGWLHSFEAHPRSVPIPKAFDLGSPWCMEGNRVVVRDDFEGSQVELAGRSTNLGGRQWRREIGQGAIQLTGSGAAKVLGTVEKPCPGRTAYTIEWASPAFADVQVTITPPGAQNSKGHKGRGGLIFWQDDSNYITLSLFMDDWPGRSIAAFFYLDGFEELYDAVWTNVSKRVCWGVPFDFRVVFDGKSFLAFINGEPVLYRTLSDVYPKLDHIAINRVGIVANWEWGNDTGTEFRKFIAQDRK